MLARVLKAALAAFALVSAAVPAAAMTVRPATFDQLVDTAAVVFEGEVTENRAARDESGNIVTYTTFTVRDAVKGSPGATYTIKQVGGTLPAENLTYKVEGVPTFKVGETYVVFLPAQSSRGFSSPVAMSQGRFGVTQRGNGRRVANGRDLGEMTRQIPTAQLPPQAAAALRNAPGPVYELDIDDFKQLVRTRAGRAR